MNQRATAWDRLSVLLDRHGASVALLQEAKRPARLHDGWQVTPAVEDESRWRIAVPRFYRAGDGSVRGTRRLWASAVAATSDLALVPRDPIELGQVVDGGFACSHPGQFAVAAVTTTGGDRLTLVSLYGIWDPVPGGGGRYVEATLHRAISDLSVILQDPTAVHVVIAGDLNLYDYSAGDLLGDRSMTVWSRLAAYGLEVCGPFRPHAEARLDGCACPNPECRHVNTYRYQSRSTSRPHQLDFVLATPQLRERLTACWADPDPGWPTNSDHRAIFATFDL